MLVEYRCSLYGMAEVLVFVYWINGSCCCFFFFKQKTAYEMRISDWSSDVCSSDLSPLLHDRAVITPPDAAPQGETRRAGACSPASCPGANQKRDRKSVV